VSEFTPLQGGRGAMAMKKSINTFRGAIKKSINTFREAIKKSINTFGWKGGKPLKYGTVSRFIKKSLPTMSVENRR
jgi:hypothetical protein